MRISPSLLLSGSKQLAQNCEFQPCMDDMVVSTHFCDTMVFVNILYYLEEIQGHISACQPEGVVIHSWTKTLKIRLESQSVFFKMNYLLCYLLYCILYYYTACTCPLGIMKVWTFRNINWHK